MADNPYVNKVEFGNSTLMDISDTTAEPGDVADGEVFYAKSGARSIGTGKYASAPVANGNADKANAILFGTVDSSSTATVFTATVAGLTQLVDGTTIYLKNTVVTSAAGFTVNVNGLGAKKCYNNMTNATQDTTIFNIAYSMLFVYDSSLDSGNGGWWIYRGYDGNTNTIGYQLRSNSSTLPASDKGYRYRLWFTSADGTKWVPANTSTSTNATSSRTPNTRAIDPFGPIVYYSTSGTTEANANLSATTIWTQYTLSLGYSFNTTGAALVLTYPAPVYIKCAPVSTGGATMEGYVQSLPSTADGKIYIWLGRAYNATNIELFPEHPVYYHDGTGIRLWTGAASSGGPSPSSSTPAMDGTASAGSSSDYARGDHVHPTDTGRAPASHAHGNITSGGDITATAPTIASGDKLIINDESASKVTNGPSFGTSTTTFLANNGTWQTPAGSVSMSTTTASIGTTGWSGNTKTVSVTGVTASNTVIVSPAPASMSAWAAAGVYCSAQASGTLTFTCATVPSESLTANVLILS